MATAAMNVTALEDAFEAFCRKSTRLESSYRELQDEVSVLSAKLEDSKRLESQHCLLQDQLSNRLMHILEILPGAVLIIDVDGTICECNSRAIELLQSPLLGCAWSVIVQREFCRGASKNGELKLRDGRWMSLARRSFGTEPGEIMLLTDITESRRTADLLQRSERLSILGEMSARLGHQIRTPLATALLYASELKAIGTTEQVTAAQRVEERLQDLGATVEEMLAFAKGTKQTGETVSVKELLTEVATIIAPQFENGSQINVEVAESDLQVLANREALKGALLNLVTNALQVSTDEIVVELVAVRMRDQICMTVTDNGPGISEEIRGRLFDPFFTTRPQGTGLGLAVVKSVAEAHDGEIAFDSGPHGTAFSICIPALTDTSERHSLATSEVGND